MRNRAIFLIVALASLGATALPLTAQSTTRPSGKTFPHPDRIRYDGQCLTIDGKDMFVFSGAFHYFRCPKPLWRDRFAKIKEAGFNTVETYVAWNWHEREMPTDVNDFSKVDMTEVVEWMKMAHEEFGLYTIIRPGPYICAEWAVGGYPEWLLTKRPASIERRAPWLRTDDPTYLAWSRHWIEACCKVIAPEQITRKSPGQPGVILFQIENEYDLYRPPTEAQRIAHLKALYKDSIANGIDVPIFTCWTKQIRGSRDVDLRNVFDAANSYERWGIAAAGDKIDKARKDQPDAPGMISELQGGWFSAVGGKLSEAQDGVTAAQCNAITLSAMSRGGTVLNYYMLFGGSNFGDWGSRTMTQTYDYAAPIRESGGVGDKYAAVYAIGQMVKELGPALARTTLVDFKPEGFDRNLAITARRTKDGRSLIFVWNKSRQSAAKGEGSLQLSDGSGAMKVVYDLEPFGFKVLVLPKDAADSSKGRWMPEPMPAIERPAVPASIKITQAMRAADPGAKDWQDVKDGHSLTSHGVYDSRYVYYRSTMSLTSEQAKQFNVLRLMLDQSDPVVVSVNSKIITAAVEHGRRDVTLSLGQTLRAGENEIVLLYESQGYSNFGANIEAQSGVMGGELLHRKTQDVLLSNWKSKLLEGDNAPAGDTVKPEFDDSQWASFTLDAQSAQELEEPIQPGAEVKNAAGRILYERNTNAVFRTSMEMTQQMLDEGLTQLGFGRIDDRGTIYINGREAARATNSAEPVSIDAAGFLKAGKNMIAVEVSNRSGAGGLTRPVKLTGARVERLALKWQLANNLGGVTAGWTQLAAPKDSAGWTAVNLDGSAGKLSDAMVQWYRVEFELPQRDAHVWAPWMAHVSAAGNGMVYLNGQHLGRWWERGPQKEYFLPECWLNFGAGQKNVLIFSLRRTDRGADLQAVEVVPDAKYAERR